MSANLRRYSCGHLMITLENLDLVIFPLQTFVEILDLEIFRRRKELSFFQACGHFGLSHFISLDICGRPQTSAKVRRNMILSILFNLLSPNQL